MPIYKYCRNGSAYFHEFPQTFPTEQFPPESPKTVGLGHRYQQNSEKQDDVSCRNILQQNFNPQEPNRVWASDITYVHTDKGFHYVCVVLDLFSRKVIAWRVSDKADTQLVMETAEEAYLKRGRPQSVLFHSDRGCQYTTPGRSSAWVNPAAPASASP